MRREVQREIKQKIKQEDNPSLESRKVREQKSKETKEQGSKEAKLRKAKQQSSPDKENKYIHHTNTSRLNRAASLEANSLSPEPLFPVANGHLS
jgi:hypothetical protein